MTTVFPAAATPRRRRRRTQGAMALLLGAATLPAAAAPDLRVSERITGPDGAVLGERIWSSAPGHVRMDFAATGFLADATAGAGWVWDGTPGGCARLPLPVEPANTAEGSAGANRLAGLLAEVGGDGALIARQERRSIAGFEATRYDVVDGSETIQERWLANELDNTDFDELVRDWARAGITTPWLVLEESRIVLESLGMGYPLRVVDRRSGNTAEAIEVATTALPASTFTPPAGCPEP